CNCLGFGDGMQPQQSAVVDDVKLGDLDSCNCRGLLLQFRRLAKFAWGRSSMRMRLFRIAEHPWFTRIVITIIVLNAMVVGMESYDALYQPYVRWFHGIDRLFLWMFTIEILIRLFAVKPWYRFFGHGWNVFDFLTVPAGHIFVGAHFI